MDDADPFHERLLAIVSSLPGAYEDRPWGSVHCKVAEKIFVGWGRHEDGELGLGFKTEKSLQSMLLASDPRFTMAKYVGKHGWVDMKIGKKPNWDEIEQFVIGSYRLIAPKKLVKELDAKASASSVGAQREARAVPARRIQSSVSKSANKTKTTTAIGKTSPTESKQVRGRARSSKKSG